MRKINPIELGQMALNDTRKSQSEKAKDYLKKKANQILGREPNTLAEAVIALKRYRETGFINDPQKLTFKNFI